MRTAHINRRKIAQRVRRDAEREVSATRGSPLPPHGTVIGRIVVEYHGQRVEAVLLQAGDKARTHGVQIADGPIELMGLYAAAAMATGKVSRVPGKRSTMWDD